MKKKAVLVFALCALCALCASCKKTGDDGVISQVEVVEENSVETVEVNGQEIPGPDETTTIILAVMNINHDSEELRKEYSAYTEPFDKLTPQDIFGGSAKQIDFVNAVIADTKSGEDIKNLDSSKLKGEVLDYHTAKITLQDVDSLTEKDFNFDMVLIGDNWYILDITEAE